MPRTTARTRTRRIPDSRLADMATEHKALKARISQLAAEAAELSATILSEMTRRNTRVVECNGIRITKSQAEPVVVDYDGLKPELTPAQRKLCEKKVFDPRGLAAAVTAGIIDVGIVSEHSEIQPSAPYITVSKVAQ